MNRISAITTSSRQVGGALVLALATAWAAAGAPAPRPPVRASAGARADAESLFFESRVRPLLARECFACHSQKVAQGGLRLDTAEGLRRGGGRGTAVVPGRPDESLLLRAVRYGDPQLRMPPTSQLSERDVRILTEWVERGAGWGEEKSKVKGQKSKAGTAAGDRDWAFGPLRRSGLPRVRRKGWVARRIDGYLLARMEAAGVRPAPAADPRTLIRRVTFDLTGLPPTPEEVEAFVAQCEAEQKGSGFRVHGSAGRAQSDRSDRTDRSDPGGPGPSRTTPYTLDPKPSSPSAYDRLVDRLLVSPHYGERWGRHWLDLARYCDVPEAWAKVEAEPWRYRDWVVRALNDDLPYDQFVLRQLAADEMPGLPPTELAALGFLGLSPQYWKELKLAPDVIKTVVAEEWEEQVNTVSSTVLGLTVACARCHDHKFDPISQDDYYALAGVFASTRLVPRPLLPGERARAVLAAREQVAKLEAEAKGLKEAGPKQAALARAAELRQATPEYDAPTVYGVECASLAVLPDGPDRTRLEYRAGSGQDVPMQRRGNPAQEGPVVPRRFLAALSRGEPARFTHGSGRRELGEAIFRDAAPLAARVMVNRVWRHHFGRGLVETPSNFGAQGDRPSHPALLDDLAARFIASGWSLKWLHREIVLSSAYRQRMPRRRLEVEAWRDAILSATGVLNRGFGGPPQELGDAKNVRRTLYGTVTRRELDDLLRLYDFPDPTAHSPARFHTTTPLQGLFVLNSPFIGRQAAALAARLRADVPDDRPGQVRRAYLLLYGRAPTPGEVEAANGFLGAAPPDEVWLQYLEVLLARSELMYVN